MAKEKTTLELQREFQEEYFPQIFDPEQREKWSAHFAVAIMCECVEFLDGINWKMWKKTPVEIDLDYLKKEMIDIQHFLNNLYLIWGMDDEEVRLQYLEKNLENRRRQDTGY